MARHLSIRPVRLVHLDLHGYEIDVGYGVQVVAPAEGDVVTSQPMPKSRVLGRSAADLLALARDIGPDAERMIRQAETAFEGLEIGGDFYFWDDLVEPADRPGVLLPA